MASVATKVAGGDQAKSRYTPGMEKALQKMRHAKQTWAKHAQELRDQSEAQAANWVRYSDIWLAAKHGATEQVRRMVEEQQFDVRKHHDGTVAEIIDGQKVETEGGGMTLLHYAAWHGHLDLTKYLVDLVRKGIGEKEAQAYVNAVDTAYSRSTPLIEACRTTQGHLNDRLAICQVLVDAGANVHHQDTAGDNCLHLSVRKSYLPLVRYFIKCTDAAVFAAKAENTKNEKPLDIAVRKLNAKETVATIEIKKLLTDMKLSSNLRLKIQKGRQRRAAKEREFDENMELFGSKCVEECRVLTARINKMAKKQFDDARKIRHADCLKAIQTAGQDAIVGREEWLTGEEGSMYLEGEIIKQSAEFKELIKVGEMKKPRNMRNECIAKIKAELFAIAEVEAQAEAEELFNVRNPLLMDPQEL
jgi:hypothetical protein